jgi:glucose/arabinose dehydrogenase
LERPIALIDVPGHDIFLIVLQVGHVLSVPRDGPYAEPRTVLDYREATVCCGEEGLLSIALDPDFGANGYLYAHYSPSAEPGTTRLSRFETTGEGQTLVIDSESELVLLSVRQPFTNHNGGTVLFGPDGMLYLGLGDGGAANDPYGHGQNLRTHLGTIIRIDVRSVSAARPYAIPPDNPFLERDGALPETWAYGLRNPWRMSFDRETGLLWAGDVGQGRIEEVSVIEAGGNYGWNIMEGSRCFLPENGCDRTGLALPVWEYSHDHGCSITGGHVYRGEAIPFLYGWYVYSDYCSERIWAIDAETAVTGGFVAPVVLWEGDPALIVSFAEDAGGELYAISFDGDGIYRIVAR